MLIPPSLTLIVSVYISFDSHSRWLWSAFLKWPNWGHLRFEMDNSTAWNYTPNPNATWISRFTPEYTLSKLETTKVCIVTDKSKFSSICNLVGCRLKSLFCICRSISDHRQWRFMRATVSDLLKHIKRRKFFKVFLSSFSLIFSSSQLTVFI